MKDRRKIIMTLSLAIVTFTAVIVLTNDDFVDFKWKNAILISLVSFQFLIGFYNMYVNGKAK